MFMRFIHASNKVDGYHLITMGMILYQWVSEKDHVMQGMSDRCKSFRPKSLCQSLDIIEVYHIIPCQVASVPVGTIHENGYKWRYSGYLFGICEEV